jgi:hypothetical protein
VVTLAELEMLTNLLHNGYVTSADAALRSYVDDTTGDSFTNHLLRTYPATSGVQRAPFLAQAQSDALAQVLARLTTMDES